MQRHLHPEDSGNVCETARIGVVARLPCPGGEQLLGVLAVHSKKPIARLDTWRIVRPSDDQMALIVEAHKIYTGDVAIIPMHQQWIAWGVRNTVDVTPLADDSVNLRTVTVKH